MNRFPPSVPVLFLLSIARDAVLHPVWCVFSYIRFLGSRVYSRHSFSVRARTLPRSRPRYVFFLSFVLHFSSSLFLHLSLSYAHCRVVLFVVFPLSRGVLRSSRVANASLHARLFTACLLFTLLQSFSFFFSLAQIASSISRFFSPSTHRVSAKLSSQFFIPSWGYRFLVALFVEDLEFYAHFFNACVSIWRPRWQRW